MNAKSMTAAIPANLSMITEYSSRATTTDCLTSLKSALPAPTSSTSLVSSNLKEKALAVFQSSTDLILSTSGNGHIYTALANSRYTSDLIAVPETSSAASCPACQCNCRPASWSERVKRSTDLILRPIAALQVVNTPSGELNITANKSDDTGESTHAKDEQSLSTRIYQSFYTSFDLDAIIGAINGEVKALVDALDDLLKALNRSAEMIKTQWTGASKLRTIIDRTNDELAHRNSRAQAQAKNLGNYCGKLAWTALDTVKTKALGLLENSPHRLKNHHRRRAGLTEKISPDKRKTEHHAGGFSAQPDKRRTKRGCKANFDHVTGADETP